MQARGLIAVITAFLGLTLVTAGPASAAEAGTWVPYGNKNPITSSNSTWQCAGSVQIAASVIAQVCAIRSAGGDRYQGAVIVRNNRSSLFSTTAEVTLFRQVDTNAGTWVCPSSGVGANSWSVCFGQSMGQGSFSYTVWTYGYGGSTWLGRSGAV